MCSSDLAMGLLGPNGAGKTTLLKTLLGLLPVDRGHAEVLGESCVKDPLALRRRVGYMPENDCYIPRMKGVRLVAFAGELSGLRRKDALTRAHEVLYYVGLDEARYRIVDQYSTGMRQRLRLAQALVHDPELLFLDEPTSGMDPRGRREMLELVEDLAKKHAKHIVLSSHLLPDVEEVCGFVVVLNRGRILTAGPMGDLADQEADLYDAHVVGDLEAVRRRLAAEDVAVEPRPHDRIRVRLPSGPLTFFRAVAEAEAQVRELTPVRSTLEEAMLGALAADDRGEAV